MKLEHANYGLISSECENILNIEVKLCSCFRGVTKSYFAWIPFDNSEIVCLQL